MTSQTASTTTPAAPTVYLVDGMNFLFRAFHALPPMATRGGEPTGAVFGFTSMLLRLLDEAKPSHLAVVFDAGGRSPRQELFAAYKANRPECPAELRAQFDPTREVVRALGLAALDARDVEADDLIATLTKRARAAGFRVVIVSSDKDLMQLCDEGVVLIDTMKDQNRGFTYGPKEVEEKFGVPPALLGDVLALMGDSVDNVPGVPGVGPKTASQLIQQMGSLDALLARIDEIKVRGADKVKAALREGAEQLRLSRQLVALDDAVATTVQLGDLEVKPRSGPELRRVLTQLEFHRLLQRLSASLGPGPEPAPASAQAVQSTPTAQPTDGPPVFLLPEGADRPKLTRPTPRVLLSEDALAEAVAALRQAATGDALGLALPIGGSQPQSARVAPLVGIALFAPGVAVYLPRSHRYLGAPVVLADAVVARHLQPLLADPASKKRVHGDKDARLALQRLGLTLAGVEADPALCSYLLDPATDHGLWALADKHLITEGAPHPRRGADLETEEVGVTAALAAAEAEASHLLGGLLLRALPPPLRALLDDLELPLSQVLATIECHGVCLDSAVLHELAKELAGRLAGLEAEVTRAAGYEVNLGSPKQLGELLFEKLGLPVVKKTKTGYSTDAEVLETLAAQNPIARTIHEHRGLAKLKSTYVDQLPLLVDAKTGRLHTSYNQVVAATGRLSSTEPNLQNVPIRTELGKRIRRAFVAAPGCALVTADYSQIELRVLAHLSQDPLLVQSFRDGADVHERTAMEMFGAEEGRKPELRRVAKMINYGIVYGLTDYGLAVRLGIDRKAAKRYIEDYFARYHGVRQFMDRLVKDARREGGARTLSGRWRPLSDINARVYTVRTYAERMAMNTPIQGTAADILKRAMIDVQARLDRDGHGARMLLTVHDELVLEAQAAAASAVAELVREAMEGAFQLSVPLKVDVGIGANWADCD